MYNGGSCIVGNGRFYSGDVIVWFFAAIDWDRPVREAFLWGCMRICYRGVVSFR